MVAVRFETQVQEKVAVVTVVQALGRMFQNLRLCQDVGYAPSLLPFHKDTQ
jgi:hypothetical protein